MCQDQMDAGSLIAMRTTFPAGAVPEAEMRMLLLLSALGGEGATASSICRDHLVALDHKMRRSELEGRIRHESQIAESRRSVLRDEVWLRSLDRLALSNLVGRGLTKMLNTPDGIGYCATGDGRALAAEIALDGCWWEIAHQTESLADHADQAAPPDGAPTQRAAMR